MMGELYGGGYAQIMIWRLEQERRDRASLARAGWRLSEQRQRRQEQHDDRPALNPRPSLWSALVRR